MIKLSLFSGIYGDDLASEKAGIETVCCVEKDAYCQKVILKHRPQMKIIGDIHDVTKAKLKEICGYDYFDIIAGGFPCQPFSGAGKQRGKDDDRYLWPEMFRVIKELHPRWVLAENVYGLISIQQGDILRQVYADLESEGYQTLPPVVLPACGVNAPHRRYRVFIVAHDDGQRQSRAPVSILEGESRQESEDTCGRGPVIPDSASECQRKSPNKDVAESIKGKAWKESGECGKSSTDSQEPGLEGPDAEGDTCSNGRATEYGQWTGEGNWWEVEPELGRTFDGFSSWLDGFDMSESHKLLYSYGNESKKSTRKILSILWNQIRTETVSRGVGGHGSIQAPKILFAYLCKLSGKCSAQDNLSFEGTETQEELLRGLSMQNQSSGTPHRPEYKKQSTSKYSDSLQTLSRFLAQHSKEAWQRYCRENALPLSNYWSGDWEKRTPRVAEGISNRINRLKSLGNAVVPAQVYPFYKAIVEIDKALVLAIMKE